MLSEIVASRDALAERPATLALREEEIVIAGPFVHETVPLPH